MTEQWQIQKFNIGINSMTEFCGHLFNRLFLQTPELANVKEENDEIFIEYRENILLHETIQNRWKSYNFSKLSLSTNCIEKIANLNGFSRFHLISFNNVYKLINYFIISMDW